MKFEQAFLNFYNIALLEDTCFIGKTIIIFKEALKFTIVTIHFYKPRAPLLPGGFHSPRSPGKPLTPKVLFWLRHCSAGPGIEASPESISTLQFLSTGQD